MTTTIHATAAKPPVNAMIEDCARQTQPNPFQPRMMVWQEKVGLEISSWQGKLHISSIMTFVDKNTGNASSCMQWLCALADQYKVVIELEPVPIANAGARDGVNLNKKQLRAWYARLGFQQAGAMMIRFPVQTTPS